MQVLGPEPDYNETICLSRIIEAAAKQLGYKKVDELEAGASEAQYCYRIFPSASQNRWYINVQSTSPYLKTFIANIINHEHGSTYRVCDAPHEAMKGMYRRGYLRRQVERLSQIADELERPDDALQRSLSAMRSLFEKIPYSPPSEMEDIANYQNGDKQFHLTLEPSVRLSKVVVLGVNIIATPLLEKLVRMYFGEKHCACKARPLGLVADGPTSLSALENLLLNDSADFARLIDKVETSYQQSRQWER